MIKTEIAKMALVKPFPTFSSEGSVAAARNINQGDEMEKVGETEIIQMFHKLSVELVEMDAPPRVTEEAKKFGLRTGAAMDLTNGWTFRRSQAESKGVPERRQAAVNHRKPNFQNLSSWNEVKERMNVGRSEDAC